MTESEISEAPERSSMQLWIVGGLALLWNAFGAYDYLLTRMRDRDYLSQMPGVDPDAMLAYIDSFPLWAQIGWGLGVWGGVLGSVLLLLRHRWAVPTFLVSLIGMLLSFGYQWFGPPAPGGMNEGMMGAIPFVIVIVGIALLLYARAMKAKGLLR